MIPSVLHREEVFTKKVLIEKNRPNRKWMRLWIVKQKDSILRTQNYNLASEWRDFEQIFCQIENVKENKNLKKELRQDFDEIFFYLYSLIK